MDTTEDFQKMMDSARERAEEFEKENGSFGPAAWESEDSSKDAGEPSEGGEEAEESTADESLDEEGGEEDGELEETEEDGGDGEAASGGEEEEGVDAEGSVDETPSDDSVQAEPEDVQRAIKLLKKRGFDVDDRALVAPTIPERKAFRKKMQDEKAKLNQRIQDFEAQAQETLSGIEQQATDLSGFKEAVKSRDFNGIAKLIGYDSWRDLNVDFARGESDPARIQMMEMRKELNDRKKAEEKRAETERQRQAQEAEMQRMRDYSDQLASELLPEVEDEQIKKFANDAAFRDTVIQHQKNAWDGQSTISVDEAAGMALKDAKGLWERLNSVFGKSGASKDRSTSDSETEVAGEPNSRATAKRKATKAKKTISQRRSKEASRKAPEKELTDAEWTAMWAKKMKEADSR